MDEELVEIWSNYDRQTVFKQKSCLKSLKLMQMN